MKKSVVAVLGFVIVCGLVGAGAVGFVIGLRHGEGERLRQSQADHGDTVTQSSASIRNMLWETAETAKQIRKSLDDGVAAWNRAKTDMEAGSEKFQKARQELDDRITWRELRRDWLTLLGLIAIGILIGIIIVGAAVAFKYHY